MPTQISDPYLCIMLTITGSVQFKAVEHNLNISLHDVYLSVLCTTGACYNTLVAPRVCLPQVTAIRRRTVHRFRAAAMLS